MKFRRHYVEKRSSLRPPQELRTNTPRAVQPHQRHRSSASERSTARTLLAAERSLGADHVIDYTTHDFTHDAARYDLIFDNVGNHSFTELRRALTPHGLVIPNSGGVSMSTMMAGMLRSLLATQKDVRFLSTPNRPDLLALTQLIDAGKLTTVIDRSYRLDQTPEALTYVSAGHARGKVVILVHTEPGDA